MSKTVKILLVLIVLIGVGIGAMLIAAGILGNQKGGITTDPKITDTKLPEATKAITPISKDVIAKLNLGVESIYNDSLQFTQATRNNDARFRILAMIAIAAEKAGWKGGREEPLPITIDSFDKTELNSIVTTYGETRKGYELPKELEELYTSETAQKEVMEVILKARVEYMKFLEAKGVNKKIIDQINTVTLPATDTSRYEYNANAGPNDPVSYIRPISLNEKDKVIFGISPKGIYIPTTFFSKSGILGPKSSDTAYLKKIRDMSIRYLAYHEFTHVMVNALDRVTTLPDEKEPQKNIRNLNKYKFGWGFNGDSIGRLNNFAVAEESQADGVAYEVLVTAYQMSEVQQKLLWEHMFGGYLETDQKNFLAVMDIMDKKFPDYASDDLADKFVNDVLSKANTEEDPAKTLKTMLEGFTLSPWGGYVFPMHPSESQDFWNFLKLQ